MVDKIIEILNNDVEAVLLSPQLSLSLCKCYSLLYMNGAAPRVCARSQRRYYSRLKIDGIMKAKQLEEAKNRTCTPNWKGLCFVSKACRHYSDELITDNEAIDALKKGFLKESQFTKLPEGYNTVLEPNTTEEVKVVKRGRKKSIDNK